MTARDADAPLGAPANVPCSTPARRTPRIGDLLTALLVRAPYICGDVVITGPPDQHGDTTSLTATARDELTARWS